MTAPQHLVVQSSSLVLRNAQQISEAHITDPGVIWNNTDIVRNLARKFGIKTQSLGAAYFFAGVLVL